MNPNTVLIWTYCIITLVNAIEYIRRTITELKADLRNRAAYRANKAGGPYAPVYTPEVTVGTIVARLAATFIPMANMICFVFDTFHTLTRKLWSIPLVPEVRR